MKSDFDLINRIEAYLTGELSPEEHAEFDQLRKQDSAVDLKVVEHQAFIQQISEYGMQKQLRTDMESIHEQLNINSIKDEVLPAKFKVRNLWNKYRLNTAIAASVAICAVMLTLLSSGYFNKSITSNYSALRREINNIKRSQNQLIKGINDRPVSGPANPGQFGGTGFALSANGYIVTNYHVVKDADSVYVQNSAGESFKVKQIFIDPAFDLAVLQIIDPGFKSLSDLPYTFKKNSSDLGEDVFTIGFPRDDHVFNKGYVSSLTGYAGDTVAYQVDISVNPGNSGGPLLDNKGNVIGIISGKQTQTDGAAFAIKSNYLIQSLASIPQDSLVDKLVLNKKNSLSGLSRTDQIKKLKDYVFMVKVY
ncbi:S1C family serine protease [Daejeonella oryzae]|uniref:S1C family serine protease n=1 Tax=Daejeonella oryzae TaxID=1122943 RepID=UPI000427BEF0|nr:S1C family serine protease [Daejeonella oryzae]